ncbi:large ribosomal subunit protein mL40-like isoform X2 [Tubulanus polymorphus]
MQLQAPLAFHLTPSLAGEPMKKKRKMDQNILIQRELKKKRKIEKMIRRLEKLGRKLKPVDEINGNFKMKKERELRQREETVLTEEVIEERALLLKEWSRYKLLQYKIECRAIKTAALSQQEALNELRGESEDLYYNAVRIDEGLVPFSCQGPVETPPIKDYDSPDGEYIDTTKVF